MYAIREWLFIGKFRETRDRKLLDELQIGAMLQLAETVRQPGIESLYLPVDDGVPIPSDLLRQGIDFISDQRAQGHRVLVACGAGISRSTAFALAALSEVENLSLLDAFREICKRHPEAMPAPALWDSLFAYYGTGTSFDQLWETIDDIRVQESP
jgi:hypothetical protein